MTNPTAHKALVQSFVDAWNQRDFARFDQLMAPDAVLNVGGGAVSCSPDGTRAIAETWTTAFPDWRFDLVTMVAEGDLVAAHMPYAGTFSHPLNGLLPTHRSAHVDEMVIFQIADNRVARAWEVYDEAGMWRQLGVQPPA
ncbi:MAG: ester cyclase [Nocardioides sp.]|nr:ester cyclase [Nocardioides sp.]